MARTENPPFNRGSTYYSQNPTPAIDPTNLGGLQHEGKIWEFEDNPPNSPQGGGAVVNRTNVLNSCMCVRNVSGINLLPKRLASLQKTGTDGRFLLGRVDGYAVNTALGPVEGWPIDEYLPAAGVANYDLFWIVVRGVAMVKTDIAAGANNVINVGDYLVALTAATTQATTAGRVAPQDLSGATGILGNQARNQIGRALSAATTGMTDNDLLIEVWYPGG